MAEEFRGATVEDVNGITVVTLNDKKIFGGEMIQNFGKGLFSLVSDRGRSKILIDLKNVECAEMVIIGKLITLHQIAKRHKGKLVLCSPTHEIEVMFGLGSLPIFIDVKKDLATGLACFA